MKKIGQKYLNQCFYYDISSGNLIWANRPRSHFKSDKAYKSYNKRMKGNIAGNLYVNSSGTKYLTVLINGVVFRVHRLVWCMFHGEMPDKFIDHIDGDGMNNRIDNLRNVSNKENQRNQRLSKRNTSGYMNVHWSKSEGKWRVVLRVDGKKKTIGCFKCKEKANQAAIAAREKYGYHKNHGSKPKPGSKA